MKRNIFLVLFLSGARVSETIHLQPKHIAWNDEALYFYDLPVLKKKNKTTSRVPRDPANFMIYPFISYVENTAPLSIFSLPVSGSAVRS